MGDGANDMVLPTLLVFQRTFPRLNLCSTARAVVAQEPWQPSVPHWAVVPFDPSKLLAMLFYNIYILCIYIYIYIIVYPGFWDSPSWLLGLLPMSFSDFHHSLRLLGRSLSRQEEHPPAMAQCSRRITKAPRVLPYKSVKWCFFEPSMGLLSHRIHGAGIYTNIGGILMVNVTIYGIHGSYGYYFLDSCRMELLRKMMDLLYSFRSYRCLYLLWFPTPTLLGVSCPV